MLVATRDRAEVDICWTGALQRRWSSMQRWPAAYGFGGMLSYTGGSFIHPNELISAASD
jgi:hypothetical protein